MLLRKSTRKHFHNPESERYGGAGSLPFFPLENTEIGFLVLLGQLAKLTSKKPVATALTISARLCAPCRLPAHPPDHFIHSSDMSEHLLCDRHCARCLGFGVHTTGKAHAPCPRGVDGQTSK